MDKVRAGISGIARRCRDLTMPLTRLGLHHQRKATRILASGERGIQTRHRAGLASSITFALPAANELTVGSNAVYAASQQFGPPGGFYESSRPGGFLAIPIGENVKGVRDEPKYHSPREVPDGEFVTLKAGLFFVRRHKRQRKMKQRYKKGTAKVVAALAQAIVEKLEMLFVLKRRVKGEAHMYVTHDPPDQEVWDAYGSDWLLRGR